MEYKVGDKFQGKYSKAQFTLIEIKDGQYTFDDDDESMPKDILEEYFEKVGSSPKITYKYKIGDQFKDKGIIDGIIYTVIKLGPQDNNFTWPVYTLEYSDTGNTKVWAESNIDNYFELRGFDQKQEPIKFTFEVGDLLQPNSVSEDFVWEVTKSWSNLGGSCNLYTLKNQKSLAVCQLDETYIKKHYTKVVDLETQQNIKVGDIYIGNTDKQEHIVTSVPDNQKYLTLKSGEWIHPVNLNVLNTNYTKKEMKSTEKEKTEELKVEVEPQIGDIVKYKTKDQTYKIFSKTKAVSYIYGLTNTSTGQMHYVNEGVFKNKYEKIIEPVIDKANSIKVGDLFKNKDTKSTYKIKSISFQDNISSIVLQHPMSGNTYSINEDMLNENYEKVDIKVGDFFKNQAGVIFKVDGLVGTDGLKGYIFKNLTSNTCQSLDLYSINNWYEKVTEIKPIPSDSILQSNSEFKIGDQVFVKNWKKLYKITAIDPHQAKPYTVVSEAGHQLKCFTSQMTNANHIISTYGIDLKTVLKVGDIIKFKYYDSKYHEHYNKNDPVKITNLGSKSFSAKLWDNNLKQFNWEAYHYNPPFFEFVEDPSEPKVIKAKDIKIVNIHQPPTTDDLQEGIVNFNTINGINPKWDPTIYNYKTKPVTWDATFKPLEKDNDSWINFGTKTNTKLQFGVGHIVKYISDGIPCKIIEIGPTWYKIEALYNDSIWVVSSLEIKYYSAEIEKKIQETYKQLKDLDKIIEESNKLLLVVKENLNDLGQQQ